MKLLSIIGESEPQFSYSEFLKETLNHVNQYLNKILPRCYIQNEKEKERQCYERDSEVDHGSFTPLLSSIYEGIECSIFPNRIAKKVAEKQELHRLIVTNWV